MPDILLSEAVCRHIAETPVAAIPDSALKAAGRALLDATGVMFAASCQSLDVAPFIGLAREAGAGPCTVLGTDVTASAPMAALANGAMAHALDYEDAFDAAPGHPNASLMPAALALAQAGPPVSGEAFAAALAIGCDFACRIGLSLRQPMEQGGWYPPPIIAAWGAAAGCARLLGLDWRQTRDALSLILCQATMPGEIMHSRDTVIRAVREAFPAQAAVIAARLAAAGVAGFEQPLEGKAGFFALYAGGKYDPGAILEALGQRWYGEDLSFKPWPACRGTHAFIELAMQLAADHAIGWRDVSRIVVDIDPVHVMLMEPAARKQAPATAIDAKFSIPFTVALALVRGEVTLDDFTPAVLSDPDVLAVASRVVARPSPPHSRVPGSGGALTLETAAGTRVQGEVAEALGGPARPLGEDRLMEKFVDCLGRAAKPVEPGRARRFGERLLDIRQEADAGALFNLPA